MATNTPKQPVTTTQTSRLPKGNGKYDARNLAINPARRQIGRKGSSYSKSKFMVNFAFALEMM
jgi:hypothetical protein